MFINGVLGTLIVGDLGSVSGTSSDVSVEILASLEGFNGWYLNLCLFSMATGVLFIWT